MTASRDTFWMTTFQEHGSAVLAFLTSRLGRRDVAEDLLQETFVRAMRASPTFPDPRKARSYLMSTAHRLILDRARRKRPVLFSEMSRDDSAPMPDVVDADAASPETLADLGKLEARLGDVLATLTDAHRRAFEAAVIRQTPYGEIARSEGWSLEQVKSNVHRARKKVIAALRDQLGPQEIAP